MTKKLHILIIIFAVMSTGCSPIVWRNFTWIEKDYRSQGFNVEQRYSDYDWWYDHCTGYTNPTNKTGHFGYVACGVSKYRINSINQTSLTYDETDASIFTNYPDGCTKQTTNLFGSNPCSSDYDFGNFENSISGKLGLGFNTIGLVRPSGTTSYLSTMNYDGEYYRVKQLSNGSFLTVGNTVATRKRPEPPQNGTPLYYNPTPTFPNNYFINTDIFNTSIPQKNTRHWDIMKFNGINGLCLFDNIYGIDDFDNNPNTFIVNGITQNGNNKQRSYFSSGSAFDFTEDNNGNIAVVGTQNNHDLNNVEKASIIKIDINGNVLSKRFLDVSNSNFFMSAARAIEIGNINGVDVYIIAVTEIVDPFEKTEVKIYSLPINFTTNSSLTLINTFSSDLGNSGLQSTIWNMVRVGNSFYIPLITNANQIWYSGNCIGTLRFAKVDLVNFTSTIIKDLGEIHAFDLKARITALSDGSFGIVSTKQLQKWQDKYDITKVPNLILDCNTNISKADKIPYWNTDAYVVRINNQGDILVADIFDSVNGSNDYDFPLNTTSGIGDPKRQECMYGISEAPDGDIVISGNSSGNKDDNYMVKIKKKLP
jgi:hypothetical protein